MQKTENMITNFREVIEKIVPNKDIYFNDQLFTEQEV